MSSKPEAIQWKEPHLAYNEEEDSLHLNLGVVHLPCHVDPENTERILAVVTELVNQMVEEDILPELLCPDEVSDYAEDLEGIEGDELFLKDRAVIAFEDTEDEDY